MHFQFIVQNLQCWNEDCLMIERVKQAKQWEPGREIAVSHFSRPFKGLSYKTPPKWIALKKVDGTTLNFGYRKASSEFN